MWRCLSSGAWAGRLPPFAEHSRSWHKHSEQGALVAILQVLWTEWGDLKGLARHQLPIEGLFSESPPSAAGVPTGAISSSAGVPQDAGAGQARGARRRAATAQPKASVALAKAKSGARRDSQPKAKAR